MLVQRLYDDPRRAEDPPRYDAIFVDEGQDFRPLWWQTLQRALRPGGEMLLAADKTQDVYSTASAWTEDTMSESGFRGQWATLGISYRLPPAVVPLAERFATEFLATAEVDLPRTEHRPEQMEFADLFPVTLRWIQIRDASTAVEACIEELKRQMTHLRPDAAASDLTILCGRQTGFSLKEALRRDRINVLNTFDHESAEEQRKKRAFFQGHAAVKSTTLHSFKGWEARHLVLLIDRFDSSEDRAIIYTALTRLRRHEHGSSMSVVCSCDSLRAYGRQWPTFLER
jgi:superfamily I DNA/RNA helicase